MATAADLPCDGDRVCMLCKAKPEESESLICNLCATPWHVPCLSKPPETMASAATWECPDCSDYTITSTVNVVAPSGISADLVASIRAIEVDEILSDKEKARKRQNLLCGNMKLDGDEEDDKQEEEESERGMRRNTDILELFDAKFNCSFCMQLPERPVTTPCGHNFCLKCFQKWTGQGKNTCVKCRGPIPSKMASLPRINSALVVAIRMAKTAKLATSGRSTQVYHFLHNDNRPDKAFTTERAKKSGKANACSGQIFVTIPSDYFGPISAEYDPKRNQGVLVGETFEDRMECRQWGVHFPHVSGIAGQADYGAQSVALSGGYEDDEDHGDWFLYTGSGGRDLSGNKRTNKEHAFDQTFDKYNEALKVSCRKGYPVRVVRSHKEKRSSYAPESGVRYDGVYRIEKCWRKLGSQGFKMCRYLFIRCDNEPAPWTSDDHGDLPRPLPLIKELKHASDISDRKETPAWDYDENCGWKWVKPPPLSKKPARTKDPKDGVRVRKIVKHVHNTSVRERLLKEFNCQICRKVMKCPLTTPCAHNFCNSCLLGSFADLSFVKVRSRENGRTLRAQKIVNKCPCCPTDISDFLQNPQVNRDMMELIETLQRDQEEENAEVAKEAAEALDERLSEEKSVIDVEMILENGINNAGKSENTNDEQRSSEEIAVLNSNSEGCDVADVKKITEENCSELCQSPQTTVGGSVYPRKKKSSSVDKRPSKKAKRVGKDSIQSRRKAKFEALDGVWNPTGKSKSQAASSKLVTPSSSKETKATACSSGVRTRSMETVAALTGSGVMTRGMQEKIISSPHCSPSMKKALAF